ncbi:MAG TPA: hypothetical protein VFS67_13150 [Polyangiaceae bacterium]|nr:hypothetical protein [Polyangiaceae bacterium]
MLLEQGVPPAVVLRNEVVAVAEVECVVPRAQVIATAQVVPREAAAEKNEYTAAARVDPGRAKEVIPRGVVPSHPRSSEARIAT